MAEACLRRRLGGTPRRHKVILHLPKVPYEIYANQINVLEADIVVGGGVCVAARTTTAR
jgi:hypothetical protein